MKKKMLTKKLTLNKKTIARLGEAEMRNLKGASIFVACSESCSIFIMCCDTIRTCPPPPEKLLGED